MALEPGSDVRGLVRRDVVEDDVELLVGIDPLEATEEGEEVARADAQPDGAGDASPVESTQ